MQIPHPILAKMRHENGRVIIIVGRSRLLMLDFAQFGSLRLRIAKGEATPTVQAAYCKLYRPTDMATLPDRRAHSILGLVQYT